MKSLALLVVGATLLATPTLAASLCASEMKTVEAALVTAKLSPTDAKKVQDLKAASAKADQENKPGDCLKAMGEAKKLLGVK